MITSKQMEAIADQAILDFKNSVDDKREELVAILIKTSAHKNLYVAALDARFYLEEMYRPADYDKLGEY